MKKQFLLILIIILLAGCGDMDIITLIAPEPEESADEDNIPFHVQINPPLRRDFDDFDRAIPIPPVTAELALIYNRDAEGDYIREYTQPDMADTLDGYVSDNYDFFETVLMPEILPKLDSLKGCEKYQAVNALTLFLHESFQEFFGLSYYRWGGDITDRDQPQVSGHTRSTKKYGMDCSGFAASPYEAAVCLGILDSTQAESYFSWFGFRYLCENDARYSDSGGRNGSSNNHRLEVFEFAIGGRLIATINAGTEPTSYQLSQMQA